MKKYVGYMVAFVFGTYLWFVLLPMWFNYSFPTGGWDWLGFVGVVGGLFLSVWCMLNTSYYSHSVYCYYSFDRI